MLGKPKTVSQADQAVRQITARYGLDRVAWIRLARSERGTSCELHGSRHHRLVTVEIEVGTALTLAQAGVPVVARTAHPGAA